MGPKRGRGAARRAEKRQSYAKWLKGRGLQQHRRQKMKKYWFQSQSSHSLTLQGIISQSSHLFQQQPPAKSVRTNHTTMQH
ncbi:hypothetical protein DPMN_050461 [Dreissena polymorpha]|uniref:Uncharacterized protein n=1 Tax=Dreissena polymorpha TaxID=45954 RepID=A0A9D4CG61_DREPO|nr:hypothetical protein DPMN_050461 [Dreissena polymorpha]